MPRAKSAYNVNDNNFGSSALTAAPTIPRNQSETNLEQTAEQFRSPATINMDGLNSAWDQQQAAAPKYPSLPSLNSIEKTESVDVDDNEEVSHPPPQTLPPSLPSGFNRGPPPPVPSARPVGAVPPPVPPSRPAPDPVATVPVPGPRPPVLPTVAPGEPKTAQSVLDEAFNVVPSADGYTGGSEMPYIPPRPKAMPVGPPPADLPPSGPPPIPTRTAPPPIPTRTPMGVPQIPPRQGTGS